jgi:hypothetical protein
VRCSTWTPPAASAVVAASSSAPRRSTSVLAAVVADWAGHSAGASKAVMQTLSHTGQHHIVSARAVLAAAADVVRHSRSRTRRQQGTRHREVAAVVRVPSWRSAWGATPATAAASPMVTHSEIGHEKRKDNLPLRDFLGVAAPGTRARSVLYPWYHPAPIFPDFCSN